jgi:hypothetical protein
MPRRGQDTAHLTSRPQLGRWREHEPGIITRAIKSMRGSAEALQLMARFALQS